MFRQLGGIPKGNPFVKKAPRIWMTTRDFRNCGLREIAFFPFRLCLWIIKLKLRFLETNYKFIKKLQTFLKFQKNYKNIITNIPKIWIEQKHSNHSGIIYKLEKIIRTFRSVWKGSKLFRKCLQTLWNVYKLSGIISIIPEIFTNLPEII